MWTKIDYFFEKNKGFYLFLLLLLPVSQYGRTNKLEKDIMKTISFNKVWLTGNEKNYITQALSEGKHVAMVTLLINVSLSLRKSLEVVNVY